MVKIKRHKPVNLYTHPMITEYEFLRDQDSISFFKILSGCVGITCLVWGAVVVLALASDRPEAVKEHKPTPRHSKPRWQPSDDMTGSLDRVEYTKRVE